MNVAAQSGGNQWWQRPPDARLDDDADIEASLLRAMENDPRLSHGAGPTRSDNVLDFIQMTGLTTSRGAAAVSAPSDVNGERADDPISFFEFGVRDVDGSGDPVQVSDPELDLDAFHVAPAENFESQSLTDLKQIIAELAAETDPAREPSARVITIEEPRVAPEDEETRDLEPEIEAFAFPQLAEPAEPAVEDEHTASPATTAGLAAARDLLRELSQANEAAAEKARATKALPELMVHPVTAQRVSLPQPEEEKDDVTTHLHAGLPRRRRTLRFQRWFSMLGMVAMLGLVGYGAFRGYQYYTQTSPAAFASAEALIDAGRYREASAEFLRLYNRFQRFPIAADALFMAGYALQLEPDTPRAAKEAYSEAIGIFERFIVEYPGHAKTPRAETLMGLLYYKTGRQLEAVNVLGSPDRRLRDPGAYLMSLRTLGQAYAELGQMENARSAFMRAAALESNMTPDADYVQLATIYQGAAAQTGDPMQRRRYFQLAVEQWDFALQVAGLLKSRKEDIKLLRDSAVSKLEALPGGAVAGEATASMDPSTGVRTLLGTTSGAAGESPSPDSKLDQAPQ